jgi:adenylylsulfate kinase-like enzyme
MSVGTGTVVWVTGLSGSGKSTVGHRVWQSLRDQGVTVLYLDGDVLREMLGAVDAHSPEQRLALAHTYGRMCKVLADQGVWVVCSTISMFHAVRRWNRTHIARYREIYLRVPIDELKRRDPKGLYARGVNMMGIDLALEEPEAPDLVIDNYGAIAPDEAERRILALLQSSMP